MNALQEKLLELLKEIDYICQKYDVEYYAAGGTVIGAVRHGGFIPWDDDADLYMTYENFIKFKDGFYKESLINRSISFLGDNPDYISTIPRYNDDSSSKICRYQVVNPCSGGTLIDILILDPISADKQLQMEYISKLNGFLDIICLPYAHAYRNHGEYINEYYKYKARVDEVGKEQFIKEFERECLKFSENPEMWVLRWAIVPTFFRKEMFQRPVYMPFEDMLLPMPTLWYEYLEQLYGPDWMYVPESDGQEVHMSVDNPDISYKYLVSDWTELLNYEDVQRTYEQKKVFAIEKARNYYPAEEKALKLQEKRIRFEIDVRLKDINLDLLFEEKKFDEILSIYKEYIDAQSSAAFVGRPTHVGWHRYTKPYLIDITEKELKMLVYSLMTVNQEKAANRILSAYIYHHGNYGKEVDTLVSDIRLIDKITKEYYCDELSSNVDDYVAFLTRYTDVWPHAKRLYYFILVKMVESSMFDADELLEIFDNDDTFNADPEQRMAYADLLWAIDDKASARALYLNIINETRNGMIWQRIMGKIEVKPCLEDQDIKVRNVSDKVGDIRKESKTYQTQFQLLEEIDELCRLNGIQYILAKDTAVCALSQGRFIGNAHNLCIQMTNKDAKKFLSVLAKNLRTDRYVKHWGNGDTDGNFVIKYGALGTMHIQLTHPNQFVDNGIQVTIEILEPKDRKFLSKLLNKAELVLSLCVDNTFYNSKKSWGKRTRKLARIANTLLKPEIKFWFRLLFKLKLNNNTTSFEKYEIRKKSETYLSRKISKKTIERGLVEHTRYIELYGKQFPVSENSDDYVKCFYGNKTIDEVSATIQKRSNGIFTLISANGTAAQILDNDDLLFFENYDWTEYAYNGKMLRKTGKKIRHYWTILERANARIQLWQKYIPLKSKIIEMYENDDWEGLGFILKEYHDVSMQFFSKKMSIYFDDEIFEIYLKWLEKNDMSSKALNIEKRVPEIHRKPIVIERVD